MNTQILLGLPLETWIIIGGLYALAAFLPTIIALILGYREAKK